MFNFITPTIEAYFPAMVEFTRKLIQTPSPPGQEATIAKIIGAEMSRLGYDEIRTDDYGNLIGVVRGNGSGRLIFNGHMDHVDPGDPAGWPHPPFSGALVDNVLWGRGTVDMKGPVACMVYAPIIARESKGSLPGDVYTTVAVMEEVGGIGSSYLAQHLQADLAIVGEPSHNTLRRGHRGRAEMWVTITGKSIHASIPEQGVNPHFILADFLHQLQTLPMVAAEPFGPSSVAPTLIVNDQVSPNVTPGQLRLTLDWRSIPSETPEQILAKVRKALANVLPANAQGSVALADRDFTTYTGIELTQSALFPSFETPANDWRTERAQQTLSAALAHNVPLDVWHFATDGGHLAKAGIPTLGFGPGDETLAHTNREHITLEALKVGLRGYTALSLTDFSASK